MSSFVAFGDWIYSPAITKQAFETNDYLCWPYFPDCGSWYFLESLPYGYSQTIFYMGLLSLIVLAVYFMWKREWLFAHWCALFLWIWKFLMIFILTPSFSANYEYYDIVLGGILLFLPFKEFFLKLTFVLFYFLASTIKFDTGWTASLYLTSLVTGLPIFGNEIAPLVTNLVIFMQVIGSWFLLSSRPLLQRGALIFFIAFHLYSGILVAYRYPTTTLPMLLALFGPLYRVTPIPFAKKALLGWALVFSLFLFQGLATFGSPARRFTLENNKYGLYMFEANHQCRSAFVVHYKTGEIKERSSASANARSRCDPYQYWFPLRQMCQRDQTIEKIAWTFDHSVNGGALYRIVDVENACDLTYKPFGHNEWISSPNSGAPIVGYPLKNYYR